MRLRHMLTVRLVLLPLILTQSLLGGRVGSDGRLAGTGSTTIHDLTQYVNPLIGTDNWAFTFPGTDVPFGMVQWSPDTTSWSPGGYSYTDTAIKGFSLTHLSGTGCSIFQDIPFMPTLTLLC